MAFQAVCLISVVLGGPNLEMKIRPCNVRRDLRSLLQTLWRQLHEDIVVVPETRLLIVFLCKSV